MNRNGVRTSAAVTLLLFALVCGFVLAILSAQGQTREDIEERFGDRVLLSARLTESVFQTTATSEAERSARQFGAPEVEADDLTRLARTTRSPHAVMLDTRGRVLAASAATPKELLRELRARPPYVRRVLSGRAFGLSDVLRPDGGRPVVEYVRAFPTAHGRRVLVTGFEPRLLYPFFGSYLRQPPGSGGRGYVLDGRGVVIGAADDREDGRPAETRHTLAAAMAQTTSEVVDGTYVASRPIEGSSWRIVLTSPAEDLFSPVTGGRMWLPWAIVGAFTFTAGLALLLLRRGIRSSADLTRSQERYELVVDGSNDGIWDRDLVTGHDHISTRLIDFLGLDRSLPENRTSDAWLARVHPEDRPGFDAAWRAHLEGEVPTLEHEHRVRARDGAYRWVLVRGAAIRDEQGRATRMAGSVSDITPRKLAEEKLRRDALHDELTGLANRALFLDHLQLALGRAKRDPASRCAVLFVDLDRFKLINDSYSHAVGDELLVELGRRLVEVLRPGDTVARLGGDEFTVLLDQIESTDTPPQVAERILLALEEPFLVHGRRVFVSASIGIALDGPGATPATMMRNADLAMYEAKRRGKSRWARYNDEMHQRVAKRLDVELALRSAIDERRMRVAYQPIIALDTGRIEGVEALARWPADLPEVGPAEFIPVAEESGMIDALGRQVLETACAQLHDWHRRGLLAADATVSVNVAGCQLGDPERFVADVAAIVGASGVAPGALRLEITESMLISEPERLRIALEGLEGLGVRAHVDDFGTGYSSLSFLHDFPGDTLKIDRSFVCSMHVNEEHHEIVRAIVSLAHSLGLRTIAEGIDDPGQLELLRALGCEMGQGFLFARPLLPEDADVFLSGLRDGRVAGVGATLGATPLRPLTG